MRFLQPSMRIPIVITICIFAFLVTASADSEQIERNGTVFHTYVVSPSRIDLFWQDHSGKRYGQFSTLQKALAAESRQVEFMMNGGIFEEGGIPSGLLIIDHRIVHPLNTADGRGNFYLKPNGVFYIDDSGAHVLSTPEYALRKPKPRLAIQSGPLLLRSGHVHPAFKPSSTNYLHRNGVGIRKDGKVVFAITEFGQKKYCSLYEFADLFRSLGCDDALFLDGDLSKMVVNPGQIPPGNYFGAIFAVAPKKNEAKEQNK